MVLSRDRPIARGGNWQHIEWEREMEGENKQQDRDRRPAEHRRPEGQGAPRSESESGSKDRNRNRRSSSGSGGGSSRKGVYRFDDQMEHAICQFVTHASPQGFPAIARSGLATMPPVEVARTGSSVLMCDNQHNGPHLWPNGDEVS
jgi:hypothetical protein